MVKRMHARIRQRRTVLYNGNFNTYFDSELRFLRPTRHKTAHFGDVLGYVVLKKTNSSTTKANIRLEHKMLQHKINTKN